MSDRLGRRDLLRTGLGAAGAAGLWAAGLGAPGPAHAAHAGGRGRPGLEPVPGMSGDRRANELWYQFDEITFYYPSDELIDAYIAVLGHIRATDGDLFPLYRDHWSVHVAAPEYPHNYREFMRPLTAPLRVLSRIQLDIVDTYYRPGDPRLIRAFADFGQGVLYDPRRLPVSRPVHTMNTTNGNPPGGYHNWHVFMQAMILLGVDVPRWRSLAPLNALAWALQSIARPSETQLNPPLPARTVAAAAAYWLSRSPRQLDRAFRSFPYPPAKLGS
jgi:hypothetical protein